MNREHLTNRLLRVIQKEFGFSSSSENYNAANKCADTCIQYFTECQKEQSKCVSDGKDFSFIDYDLVNIDENVRKEILEGFVKETAKHTLELFLSMGLKTHIECKVVNDQTNEEFTFSFKKIIK